MKYLMLFAITGLLLLSACSQSSGKAYDVSEMDMSINVKCTLNVGTEYYVKDKVIKILEPDGSTYWLTEFAFLELKEDYILVMPTSEADHDYFQVREMLNDEVNLKCVRDVVADEDVVIPDLVLLAVDEFNGDVDFVLEQIRS
ncbi:hypothetical protein JW868_03340 [Candidatus Woesearchaeota archaeon]|nr:hypothetical protein [Candidatus Woesearchaeota archaeon]